MCLLHPEQNFSNSLELFLHPRGPPRLQVVRALAVGQQVWHAVRELPCLLRGRRGIPSPAAKEARGTGHSLGILVVAAGKAAGMEAGKAEGNAEGNAEGKAEGKAEDKAEAS